MDRKRLILWLFVSNCVITALNFSLSCAQSLNVKEDSFSYLLEPIIPPRLYDASHQKYLIVDLDKDGIDERVEYVNTRPDDFRSPSKFIIYDWSLRRVLNDEQIIDGQILGIGCFDVYGNPKKEVICFELINDMIYLNIYNVENYNPERFTRLQIPELPIPRNLEETTFAIYPIDILDWDGDGSLDLLVVLYTSYSYQPRGVWIIDIFTGKILLRKQVGPLVSNVITHDVDNDSRREILFGGSAIFNSDEWPESERFYNGTDDSKSWLFIVDDDGEFLSKIPTGSIGSKTEIFVQDLNRDGTSEIIVINSERSQEESSFVAFLDLSSKQLIKRRTRYERLVPDLGFFDWQEDGKIEFLTLWANGLLEIRDDENNVVKSVDTQLTDCRRLKVFDLERDGVKEIAIWGNSGLILLDNNLKIMAYNSLNVNQFNIISPGYGKNNYFSIFSRNKSFIFELKKNLAHLFYLPPLAIITFIVGIVFTLLAVGAVYHKRRYAILLNQEFSSNLVCFLLDAKGRIVKMGPNASKLLLVELPDLRNINFQRLFDSKEWNPVNQIIARTLHQNTEIHNQEVVVTSSNQQRYFMVNLISVKTGLFSRRYWLLTLQETTELVQSKQALAWASLAQRMAHEIKTPLSTVMLAAQQLQMKIDPKLPTKDTSGKYIDHIIEQVNRLRRTTDVFMKFAHIQQLKLQPANMNQIVKQCLNELSGMISKNIKVHTEFETELPAILLDQEQMSIAIKNLLENAINAMEDKGILTVTTRLEQILHSDVIEKDAIALEISDTGCGISEDQLSQIFEPFFTLSRGGTGLGLTLVKKIMQDHRGDIRFKSKVGIGTTVIVTLPVKFEE